MSRTNESTQPPTKGVAKGMGELMGDIASLVELQFKLFNVDCRDGLRRILIPLTLLLFAGITAVGAVPIVLMLLAELLVQAGGLSRAAAFLIAALSGVLAAATLGIVGWRSMRGAVQVFDRSREELTRNIAWVKQALKRPPPMESPQQAKH
jgi:hypothetical protein